MTRVWILKKKMTDHIDIQYVLVFKFDNSLTPTYSRV